MASPRGGFSIKVKGRALQNARNTADFMEDLKKSIVEAVRQVVEESAQDLKTKIVNVYENQSVRMAPLSKEYLAWKTAQGFDTRKGFKTGKMVKSIRFYKDSKNKFFVGIRRNVISGSLKKPGRKRKTITIPQYAAIFEFGSRNQPARPVFRPMLRAALPRIVRNINREIKVAARDVIGVWGRA